MKHFFCSFCILAVLCGNVLLSLAQPAQRPVNITVSPDRSGRKCGVSEEAAFTVRERTTIEDIRGRLLNPDTESVLVVAHRGDWRYAPENSLAAIENVIKMGVDIVEIDVQKTRDGHLILMHDKTLNRTTTGEGNVSDWTLDSIRTLKLRNGLGLHTGHAVPTLEEALLLSKGKIMINLDKAYGLFDEVFALLEKTGTTNQVIMKGGYPAEQVRKDFGRYLDKVIFMPVINLDKEDALAMIDDYMRELSPVAFEFSYVSDANPLPREIGKRLKGKNLIWYNTLWDTMAGGHDDDLALKNPDKAYGYLIDTLNVRIIQTDRPEFLIRYLKDKNRRTTR
jgi:glycerophosphoryl diester phosphodiesterase